ncbi:MAG: hypothetical protein IJ587_05100 [Synergistaceae bacterium]|nr:hypothetical protein [Synergistaceae bacterium]
MPQLLLNIPNDLQQKVIPIAQQTNETTEQLALRLLQEYVEDCEEADRLEALIHSGNVKTYTADNIHKALTLH